MARQIYRFTVSTPANTPASNPFTTLLKLPPLVVDTVKIRVPPGPSGQLGFYLAMGGQQIIPYQAGQWIVTDDEKIEEDIEGFVDSGGWSMVSYNTGSYAHSVQVSFGLSLQPNTAGLLSPQPLAL